MLHYLCGQLPQGRIGIGPSSLKVVSDTPANPDPSLTLAQVDATFHQIGAVSGKGSKARRLQLLADLLAQADGAEQRFLFRLLGGEMRQGAQEGVLLEALAQALRIPSAKIRRALMLTADLVAVASLAEKEGEAGLDALQPQPFKPLRPMLASPAEGLEAALQRIDRGVVEVKLDGVRIQVHRRADKVRVFSRSLKELTYQVPEAVEAALTLTCRSCILDGEALALNEAGEPRPFQETMRRFGRKLDLAEARRKVPLTIHFFDLMWLDGTSLLEAPLEERRRELARLVGPLLVETSPLSRCHKFFEEVTDRGHEGVMVKDLTSPYEAGSRGFHWLKVKPAHTLDLVVLAAEWGSGRRRGWLSNLHLGARKGDGFAMLGKTFKGMTDADLEWQTRTLLSLERGREGPIVYVEPSLVVEVAFDSLQVSPHYPDGLALRFARVKRYRTDKSADQAETLETVRALSLPVGRTESLD